MLASAPLLIGHASATAVVPFVITAVLFSIAPDIDVFDVFPFSELTHRGLTHTVWFGLSVCGFLTVVLLLLANTTRLTTQTGLWIVISAGFGLVTHLTVDTLMRQKGLRLLAPVTREAYHIPLVSSTAVHNNCLFVAGAGLTLILYAL